MCLLQINNCLSYQTSSIETTQDEFRCSNCKAGYHLNGKGCSPGTITNCKSYSSESTYDNEICAECENQYYFSDNKCYFINDIMNCDLYSQT